LAAEAKNPRSLVKLKKYIGGSFEGKKIAYIPTAANGEFYGSWKGGESIQEVLSLGAEVKVVELESCVYQDIYPQIRGCDILWMAGGQSGYLLYWIRRSMLDKKLNEILDEGTIYVGSSAGSMVCSRTQYASEWFIGEPEPCASLYPGLGLIDFEIYPHYEDELLPQIKKLWTKGELYLLKNGEVIIVEDDKVEVLGKKRILSENK
jgi:dipeptidase E